MLRIRSLTFAAAALALLPAAANAQRVVADIAIQDGPVTGHVIIGQPPEYRHAVVRARYHRPETRVIVVYRRGYDDGWYHRRGYRVVRVWYDARYDRYYDRYDARYPGLREMTVYERDGRFYRTAERNDYRRRVAEPVRERQDYRDHRDHRDHRDDRNARDHREHRDDSRGGHR